MLKELRSIEDQACKVPGLRQVYVEKVTVYISFKFRKRPGLPGLFAQVVPIRYRVCSNVHVPRLRSAHTFT